MKNTLTIVLVLIAFTKSFTQAQDTTVLSLTTQLNGVSSKLNKANLDSSVESSQYYIDKIDQINQEIIAKTTAITNKNKEISDAQIAKLRVEIDSLNSGLQKAVEREKEIITLNNQVKGLIIEINGLRKYKELTEDENKASAALSKKADSLNNEIIRSQVTLFAGNIETGRTAYQNFAILALTAEGIIIFDEKTNQKVWKTLKSGGLNIASITMGGLALNGFQKNKNGEAAVYAGIGVGIQLLQSSLKDKKYLESLTRNVAFADEIRALSKIAIPLNNTSKELFAKIPTTPVGFLTYFPDRAQLENYYKIIDYNKHIQVQFYNLKSKAENLIQLGETYKNLDETGKKYLDSIIALCDDSIKSWNEVEPSYRQRYNLLLEELNKRERKK